MSVEIRIFDFPEADYPRFTNEGIALGAASVDTVERLYTPGHFTIEIPREARHADRLSVERLVRIKQPDTGAVFWGIVDTLELNMDTSGDKLTVSGRQLKGLTLDRITIPPAFTAVTGAQGYDPANGTTETVMKHFVSANLANPVQPDRQVCGLEIAPDLGRGIQDDKYMSRHEVLADVLADLGEAAQMGYDIIPDLSRHKLVFDVLAGADHTALQSDRKRVILDVARKTVLSQQYQYDASEARNLFYTTKSGSEFADEALTVTYIRTGEEEPTGIHRREKHLSISADTPIAGEEYQELRRLALIEADGYKPKQSFTCTLTPGVPGGGYLYGRDYRLGDLVTVRHQDWGITMHARLTEMETNWTASGVQRTATFGDAPLNPFGLLRRMIKKG